MTNDLYYYGTYSPEGWITLANKHNFHQKRILLVSNTSFAVKQQLFACIKKELVKENIAFTDLSVDSGSMGVAFNDTVIADKDLSDFGECEEIRTDEFVDMMSVKKCENRIAEIKEKRESAEKRCIRFLSACENMIEDAQRLDGSSIDVSEVNRFSSALWRRYGGKMTGKVGKQTRRFVTCITGEGVELNLQSFDLYCKKTVAVCDKSGACSRLIIDRIRRYALSSGYDIISCICPMNTRAGAEHVIIPELEVGFFSSEFYHRADFKNTRKIFASRFHKPDNDETKQRIDFTLRAYRSLMEEAFDSLISMHSCDKKLDEIYLEATDCELLNKAVLNRIL